MTDDTARMLPSLPRLRIAIFLAGLFVFLPTISHDFVYDDLGIVRGNIAVHHPSLLPMIWTTPYWGGSATFNMGHVRPVTLTTFAVTWWMVGDQPWLFHLTNAILHALCGLLVFDMARRWLGGVRAAGIAALVFALHPVHVESVASIVGRAEILVVLFGLLAWRVHMGGQPTWRRAAGVGALMTLALLSKAHAITLVGLIAADAWLSGREARRIDSRQWWRGQARLFAGHAMALVIFFAMRFVILGGFGAPAKSHMPQNPLTDVDTVTRLLTAVTVMGFHWRLFVWPHPLRPDYSFDAFPLVESVGDPRFLAALGVMIGLLALLVWSWRRRPGVALAIIIYYGAVSLVSNLVVVIGVLMAERNLYLPSLGFCLLVGAAGAALWHRWAGVRWVWVVIAVAMAIQTVSQSQQWRDNRTLFETAARTTPRSTVVWVGLSEMRLADARDPTRSPEEREALLAEGEACAQRALDIFSGSVVARHRMAQAAAERGDIDAAARWLDEALELQPNYQASMLMRLAIVRARREFNRIEPMAQAALAVDPNDQLALQTLARWRLDQGRAQEALALAEQHAEMFPIGATPWMLLAEARAAMGDRAGAAEARARFERWRGLMDADTSPR